MNKKEIIKYLEQRIKGHEELERFWYDSYKKTNDPSDLKMFYSKNERKLECQWVLRHLKGEIE